jgi:DNA-binding CsgD family transcriptional regulator
VAAGSFEDREQALDFVIQLIDFLNDLFSKKDSLRPDHRQYRHQSVLDIFKLLPRTNCQECGFPTCMAFAAALSTKQVAPEKCPWFPKPISETAAYPVYDENGRLVSTTEIELNVADRERSLKARQEGAGAKEHVLAAATQELGETGFEGDHDGVRVRLTGREVEVLRFMAEGFTNPEISEILSISHHTVKSHVVHIFNKLGVNDRTQAAVWAARNRLV